MIETPTLLVLRLLGTPEFAYGDELDSSLTQRALAVFAYLLIHRDRDIPRDMFAFTLWPDAAEDDARANLRRSLYALQRWLPQTSVQWFFSDRKRVRWNPDAPYRLDIEEFETHVRAGRLSQAVDLYRGDLMRGYEDEWIAAERERYQAMYLDALRDLTAHLRQAGDVSTAMSCAAKALKIDPWREDFVRERIELRALTGDRAGALHEYQTFEQALKQELDAAPERETIDLVKRLRAGQSDGYSSNLPAPVTALIGRDDEVRELQSRLAAHRLVTISGSGGVGKTRLALEVGARIAPAFRDGVWLIDLARISIGEFVPSAAADALNIRESADRAIDASVITALTRRETLLIFDNCEHVIAQAAYFIDDLLHACPNLRVLATSREPLELEGEQVYRIPPLSLPDGMPSSLQDALRYAAIRLFVERGQFAQRDFKPSDEDVPTLVEICRHLDGIALAIELAAARLGALSLSRVNEGLGERFRLLTGGMRTKLARHQTLKALIDWSYSLLGEGEKALLRRTAIFAGGFSLDAAVAVCGDLDQFEGLNILGSLVKKSLVVADGEQERFALLESMRAYLQEDLDRRGEHASASRAHAEYYRSFARRADELFHHTPQIEWFSLLAREYGNLREALLWAFGEGQTIELGAEIAGALERFWFNYGRLREGLYWLDGALERLDQDANRALAARLYLARAVLLYGAKKLEAATKARELYELAADARGLGSALRQCALALRSSDAEEAESCCRRAVEVLRDAGDTGPYAMALNTLGSIVAQRGAFDEAYVLQERALQVAVEHANDYAIMHTHLYLADLEFQRAHYDEAITHANEALARVDPARSSLLAANLRCNIAVYRIVRGDYSAGAADVLEALRILRDTQDPYQTAIALQHVALMESLAGSVERAATITGYVDAFLAANAIAHDTTELRTRRRIEERLRASLVPERYEELMTCGAALKEPDVVALAEESARVMR